ncbi:Mpo1-like protein [Pseudoalteromonas sp.]|uniref:Mpo1-like protein n=1 Tax=Pseudoalteromonas sp. TaxID=53249 RepID=UPI0035698B16
MHSFSRCKTFYLYYLNEHRNATCRRLHFVDSRLVFIVTTFALYKQLYTLLWLLPVIGYGFTCFGHYFFEKSRPARFQHPIYTNLHYLKSKPIVA